MRHEFGMGTGFADDAFVDQYNFIGIADGINSIIFLLPGILSQFSNFKIWTR